MVGGWLAKKKARDYVVVQAYLEASSGNSAKLETLCAALQSRLGVATTLGFGPRFLHSTGQLHKGGPNSALVLQIVDQPSDNLAVPETSYTFDALITGASDRRFHRLETAPVTRPARQSRQRHGRRVGAFDGSNCKIAWLLQGRRK